MGRFRFVAAGSLAAAFLGVLAGSVEAQVAPSITTNFNGTNINPPAFIWFNSVFKIKSGTVNVGDKLFLTGGTIVDADTDPQNFVPNPLPVPDAEIDRKSTRLNSSHV